MRNSGHSVPDAARLGSLAIFVRCIQLLLTNSKLFMSVLTLLVFPTVVLERAISLSLFGDQFSFMERAVQDFIAGKFRSNIISPEKVEQLSISVITTGLLHAVFSVIRYTSVAYTVASVLARHMSVSVVDAAGAVRMRWIPVMSTSLCLFALDSGFVIINQLFMYCDSLNKFPLFNMIGITVNFAARMLVRFAVQLAAVVPVLEDTSGWNALNKSWKLLRVKKFVAFRLLVLITIVRLLFRLIGVVANVARHVLLLTDLSVLPLAFTSATGSLVSVLYISVETLLYFVCQGTLLSQRKENTAASKDSLTSCFFNDVVTDRKYELLVTTEADATFDV